MNIKLLDCTLRDGGYNNDWDFGHDILLSIYERSLASGVDFIELGFIDDRRSYDPNRSILPDTASVRKTWGHIDKGSAKIVGMIDYGTCDISRIEPCKDSYLDGIRVIFKMELMHEALAYCAQLKELGYLVFAQGVSFTTYTEDKLAEIVGLLNHVKPYAFAIVDTYGLMDINLIGHYYDYLDRHLEPSISIGFHAHNNFQLAFANCMELARKHGKNPRPLLLDGSIYGMGKGAGNAPLELLITYMNENHGTNYDINPILEAIDVNIIELHKQLNWGYTLKSFLAALNDCHPSYVSYLLSKKTLSVKSTNEILQKITAGKAKLHYDKNLIEQLYLDYQKNTCNDAADYQKLNQIIGGKNILLVGPGLTICSEIEQISDYIQQAQPTVIAINFIPDQIPVNHLFITNSKRYVQQSGAIHHYPDPITLIATSNVTKSSGNFDINLDYESLIDRDAVFIDNSFIMALKMMIRSGVNQVALAGFDGYSLNNESDYFSSKMEYEFSKRMGQEINQNVNQCLDYLKKDIQVQFITSTLYKI